MTSAKIQGIVLAVILNIFMRYVSSAHMLLVWHRLQFESSGVMVGRLHQVDKAIVRVHFLLLVTNLVIFAKALLGSYLIAKIVTGVFFVATLFIFIYSCFLKTISLSVLEDKDYLFDPHYAMQWWNFYKHPLTAMAKSKLDMVTTEECRRR